MRADEAHIIANANENTTKSRYPLAASLNAAAAVRRNLSV